MVRSRVASNDEEDGGDDEDVDEEEGDVSRSDPESESAS